jgi:hypothetical protein
MNNTVRENVNREVKKTTEKEPTDNTESDTQTFKRKDRTKPARMHSRKRVNVQNN